MKYMKRAGIYKASNVQFNPETCQALSYDWWRFVDRVGGQVIFNHYNYSPSTVKHQYKVRDLLRTLGIAIDLEIEAPDGLQNLDSARAWHLIQAENLEAEAARPRTRKSTNERRLAEAAVHRAKAATIAALWRCSQ